jgi:dephospho-CoA kinase
VVSSDEIVHHLIRNDPEVKSAMVEQLGQAILDEDGDIDRSRVAARVFGDRKALAWLEALLHPLVSAEYLRWRAQLAELPNAPEVCVTEVPLLYEVGGDSRFDKVVVITAPEKLRESRSKVPLAGRSERLLPDEEKVARADYSYVNTGSVDELEAFVAGVMAELRASRESVSR